MKNIKKICKQLTLVAACFLLIVSNLCVVVSAEELSGNCGNGVKWSLSNGVLTISGNGEMDDYSPTNTSPWHENRNQIINIVIENNVKRIGNFAFYGSEILKQVSIGNSVTSIGNSAFLDCINLENVKMGSSVTTINDCAFKLCKSLQSISLPSGLQSIGYEAFFNCKSLKSVTIPSSVTHIKSSAFAYCSSLLQVIINAGISYIPDWLFYGCTALKNITLPEKIEEIGSKSFNGCENLTNLSGNTSSDIRQEISSQANTSLSASSSSNSTYAQPDDSNVEDVLENENVVINGSVNGNETSLDATISKPEGWTEVIDKVKEYDNLNEIMGNDRPVDVNISIPYDDKVKGDLLTNLAGEDVNIVIKGENIQVEIDCNDLVIGKKYKDFKIEYELEEIENPNKLVKKAIGDAKGFYLKFKSNIDFNITVKILINPEYTYSIAALYQKDSDWDLLQSVTIDREGFASFYLSNFDVFTKYLIGIDVDNVDTGIIPDSLYDDYDGLMDAYGNRYVITGSESKWGLSVGQVTIIMIAVMVITFATIGGVMLIIKKRKETKERIRYQVMNEVRKNKKDNHV